MQTLVSPEHHAMLEQVVVTVRDSADVTQKADILTPPLSLWAMGTNLENSFFVLRHGRTPDMVYATVEEAQADGAVTENTGHFIKACINFVFIAFCLFWVMK
ncbi:hypothetical protein DFQ26_004759, partial [Actinomortierella ambigua]